MHRGLRKRRGVQGDLISSGFEGGDPGADQPVKTSRHLERLRGRPAAPELEVAPSSIA